MNPMSAIVNNTASGAITEATALSTGSVWQVLIFFLAFALLATVIGLIYKAISRRG